MRGIDERIVGAEDWRESGCRDPLSTRLRSVRAYEGDDGGAVPAIRAVAAVGEAGAGEELEFSDELLLQRPSDGRGGGGGGGMKALSLSPSTTGAVVAKKDDERISGDPGRLELLAGRGEGTAYSLLVEWEDLDKPDVSTWIAGSKRETWVTSEQRDTRSWLVGTAMCSLSGTGPAADGGRAIASLGGSDAGAGGGGVGGGDAGDDGGLVCMRFRVPYSKGLIANDAPDVRDALRDDVEEKAYEGG
jgi:hypothetical protein